MCRLLGYVTRTPTTVAGVIGAAELEGFRHLSRTHGDGWGAAWPASDGVEVRTSTEPADDSDAFRDFAQHRVSDASLVHLRMATLGLTVSPANTHPFTDGTVAFAHNGSVVPPESLDALIDPELAPLRRGDTDSERVFLILLGHLRDTDAADALARTVNEVAAASDFTSLNCMLLTPAALHVVSQVGNRPVESKIVDTIGYYDIHYRLGGDSVVVGSSGWPQHGWTPLPSGFLLTVDRATLATSTSMLQSSVTRSA
ncbi:MAG: egtC 2 [Frankiales bacterium]|nr:egtC 2 [Frankiales bacterium]